MDNRCHAWAHLLITALKDAPTPGGAVTLAAGALDAAVGCGRREGAESALRDVVAWHRDRDRARSAEDVFLEGYESTRKGMGLAEAIYRGTRAVAKAIEDGECAGAAEELARREAVEGGG